MKIIITESQYNKYKHLFEESVYYDDEEEGNSNNNYDDNENPKEGTKVKGNIGDKSIVFKYHYEDVIEDGNIDYYGEILFNDNEYYGYFTTDKRGYLIDVDFPVNSYKVDSSQGEPDTLQSELKKMGLYYDFDNWLDSEVIPTINH